MSLFDPLNVHAHRYATEATKLFLMQQYKKDFPEFFENATIQTRPATHADYFVPPALAHKAIVVVSSSLDKVGCLRLSCFPFKEKWEPCTDRDPPQWVQVGQTLELACSPICNDYDVNTEWVKGRCYLANPYKKMVASMPEKLFERRAYRHVYHGGLDVVEGTLKFNREYCDAYGLEYVNDECQTTAGQSFVEFFLGKTAVRAIKTAHLKRKKLKAPPLPAYLKFPKKAKKRTKRSAIYTDEDDYNEMHREVHNEIALELTKELGENVTEFAVQQFLKKKAPQLLSKITNRATASLVIKQSMAAMIKEVGTSTLKVMAKGVSVVAMVYAVYEVVGAIVDMVDPLDFQKFLTKKDLEKVNDTVDYRYYQTLPIRPELTPELIWKYNFLKRNEAETEKLVYMAERTEEYVNAVKAIPPRKKQFKKAKLTQYEWQEDTKSWNRELFISLSVVAIFFVLLFIEWIDLWTTLLLFFKMYYGV